MEDEITTRLNEAGERLKLKQAAEALEIMDVPETSILIPMNFYYIRALCLFQLDRTQEAVSHLYEELRLFPENHDATRLLTFFTPESETLVEATQEEIICKHGIISFSQTGEDVLLLHLLNGKTQGKYVDIGSFHPIVHSNTFMFYHLGWSGINIDATPGSMNAFEKFRPRDINLNIGISSELGELEFFMFNNPEINSFNRELSIARDNDEVAFPNIKIKGVRKVSVKPLSNVLAENFEPKTPIDFFSIDVEGQELDVLASNNWEAFCPDYIILEQFEKFNDINSSKQAEFLKALAYEPIAKTTASCIYKKM
ncbi:MAG: FkbM family methyltransferase [Bdellovibrionota bacterium]